MPTSHPPLRVAIVAPALPIFGGHTVQAQRMLQGWTNDPNVRAWLVPINPVPTPPFNRLLRFKYVRTVTTQLWYWPLLVWHLRSADVVHLFSAAYTGFLLSTLPAIVVAKVLRKPVVLNYHSGAAPDHLARSRVARWVLEHSVDLNVVPSRFLQKVFATVGLDAKVISNTVDLDRFAYRVREPLRPHLISTRSLEPLYNVGCTLRAFARIQRDYPDATLAMVGGGSQDAALRELAAQLGLRNVNFVGTVSPADMARHYAAADIYVQTPSVDNMPLSVLEAFACGLPVVSTDVGGVPVILSPGVHGLLAPDNDDHAIADRVLQLLKNPDYARQLATAARDSCSAYEWAAVRDVWFETYRAVLRQPSDGAPLVLNAAVQRRATADNRMYTPPKEG